MSLEQRALVGDADSSGEGNFALDEVLTLLRSLTAGQQRVELSLKKLAREVPAHEALPPGTHAAVDAQAVEGVEEEKEDYPNLDSAAASQAFEVADADADFDRSASLSPMKKILTSQVVKTQDCEALAALPLWLESLNIRGELKGSEEQLSEEFSRSKWTLQRDQQELASSLATSGASRVSGGLPWVPNMSPSSSVRVGIDLLSFSVLAYDLWSVPYLVAFDTSLAVFTWFSYASVTYWIFDMILNFKTGFYANGELEMRTGSIIVRYLKGSFGVDCCLILVDLIDIIRTRVQDDTFDHTNNLKLVRIFKFPRLLRLLGVLRLRRLRPFIEKMLMAHHASKLMRFLFFVMEVGGFVAIFVWLNHVLACLWIFLAEGMEGTSDTGVSWMNQMTGSKEYASYRREYIYSTALHWAITQMTPGSMQVFPQNTGERWYNIVCLVAGLVIFSTIISAISARVTSFRIQMQSHRTKMDDLTGFLERSGVRAEVRVLVLQQVEKRLHETRPIAVKDLDTLGLLSLSLRGSLQLELCDPHLLDHPYLTFVAEADHTLWKEICHACVDFNMLMQKDTLFIADSHAAAMYFVTMGNLSYTVAPASIPCPPSDQDLVEVESGKSLSEAALWCHWRHVGTAEVTTAPHCEVLSLQARKLVKILTGDSLMRQVTWAYGRSFCTFLKSCVPPISSPTDLVLPFEVDEVIASMPKSATILCAQVAIKILKQRPETLLSSWIYSVREDNTRQLINEVNEGGSTLLATKQGVVRCVPLLLLRLTRTDHRILVRLRLIEKADGTPEATCKLPGGRQEAGEHPDDCLRRLLRSKLRPLKDGVYAEGFEKQSQNENSQKFGVPTRYVRTVICADWKEVADGALSEFLIEEAKRQMPQVLCPKGSDPVDVYVPADVYSFPGGDVYAWLTLNEYAHFDSPRGQKSLFHWLVFLGMSGSSSAVIKSSIA